jgi:hypothetical protein
LKKLAAILLLCLLAFNLVGYKYFFSWLQQRHKILLEAKLDKNKYDESDLIELKVPLSLPYVSDQSQFERVDGYITIEGKSYKYVKRKIENGQLILLCLPDKRKMGIDQAKNQFGTCANDIPNCGKKNSESVKKITFTCEFEEAIKSSCNEHSLTMLDYSNSLIIPSLNNGFLSYTDKPPKCACN